ncbi:MAG: hypothetical protein NTX04_01725, partial [Verrucomicrobia bacterium]|nr:hypothetical protein [Verrucomicrobiota bacterium]
NLFFPLVFLALLPSLLLRVFRRGGYREKFAQRLAFFSPDDLATLPTQNPIWIHSISVGETLLALQIIAQIRLLFPDKPLVLSVTTSTAFALAQSHTSPSLQVIYNPIDSPFIVRKTLRILHPDRLIFIEAIWPNLLASAKSLAIPVSFLPRLSPRSAARFLRAKSLTGPLFRLLDSLAVAEPADRSTWMNLGVPSHRIHLTGNPKFDAPPPSPSAISFCQNLFNSLNLPPHTPVLLAGSTFPGEELILTQVFLQLRALHPSLFLILVPRHAERTPHLLKELAHLPVHFVRRSQLPLLQSPTTTPDALLVDSTGELRAWYSLASIVFIGKSLTASGGQNPLEPALAGKPVLFGPQMQNFAPIVTRWLAADAAIQITNPTELHHAILSLLDHPQHGIDLARRALAIASSHSGATLRATSVLLSTH